MLCLRCQLAAISICRMSNYQQQINKFVDRDFAYWIKHNKVPNMFNDLEQFKRSQGKKYSFLINLLRSDDETEKFYNKIREHMNISDHVCVHFNEPGFYYTGGNGDPYCTTTDFINRFDAKDNVTFFASTVSHVHTNRPLHFVQKMLWPMAFAMYKEADSLLDKLVADTDKDAPLHWEILLGLAASHKDYIYDKIQSHPLNQKVFMKYFKNDPELGSWSSYVRKPKHHTAETIDNLPIRISELIDPEIYNKTYYSFICETFSNPKFACFTEKFAKPIIAQRPFVIFGSEYHLQAFRSLGFKTFHPVIDESYDEETSKDRRIDKIIQAMHKLSQQHPGKVLQSLRPVLEHNKKHFFNNQWNAEFLHYWNH